jgi:hypothetical protein
MSSKYSNFKADLSIFIKKSNEQQKYTIYIIYLWISYNIYTSSTTFPKAFRHQKY